MRRFLLLNLFIVFVHAEIPCELHDVTTLIHLTGNARNSFEIHSRTDAVGLPLDFPNEPRFKEPDSAFWCEFGGAELCSGWASASFVHSNVSLVDPYFGNGGLRLSEKSGEIETPEFASQPSKAEVCIALRYSLDENVTVSFVVHSFVNNTRGQLSFAARELKGTGKVVTQQFSFPKPRPLQETTKMKLKTEFTISEGTGTFVLRSVKECFDEDLNVVTVNQDTVAPGWQRDPIWYAPRYTKPEIPLPMLGYGVKCHKNVTEENNSLDLVVAAWSGEVADNRLGSDEGIICENGGIKVNGYCQCFPGYIGPLCEDACPPRRFGKDCGNVCNPLKDPGCKGIKLAGPGMEFACPRGYHGDRCESECSSSWHGPSCKMRCGHCLTGVCDPFSGLCSPCAQGYYGPRCNKRRASAKLLVVTETGFDFIKGYINITLEDEELNSYPYVEIKYMESGGKEKGILNAVESNAVEFHIRGLQPGRTYSLCPVLIHESGSYFKDADLRVNADTQCNACSEVSNIGIVPEKTRLTVNWTVTDLCEYSCPRSGLELEIYLPDLDETLKAIVGPDDITKKLILNVPGEGAVRLKPIYLTRQGSWSNSSHYQHNFGFLKVVNKTDSSVDLVWKKNDGPKDDLVECEGVPVNCSVGHHTIRENVHLISDETFTVSNLHPFSQYECSLRNEKLSDYVTTNPSLPSNAPRPHPTKSTRVVWGYSGTVYWLDPECMNINGLLKGYLAELYLNGTLVKPAEKTFHSEDYYYFHYFGDLTPGTEYEARIYVVNHIGYNANKYYSIRFKTKP